MSRNYDITNSLETYLLYHAKAGRAQFHMPGHKGAAVYRRTGHEEFLERFMDCDITEIPGADDLFEAEGVILEAQLRYAELYGAKESHLLVNGTSGGLISSILAAVPRGGKLIVARNCHKSVFNALVLGDITPVYAQPEILPERGICGKVPPKEIARLLEEHPDAAGALVVSPNYYGIQSDLKAIADILHEKDKVLIVDQAHGAHQVFFDRLHGTARSAEFAGADLCVDSIHKTMAGFGQSAILNVGSDRVDPDRLADSLQMIQSSSPSYILMAGLEINAKIMESPDGETLIREWDDNVKRFYEKAKEIPGLSLLSGEEYDPTKLNVGFGEMGMSGDALYKILDHEYAIDCELYGRDFVMALTGIGNPGEDYDRLLDALADISRRLSEGGFAKEMEEDPMTGEEAPVIGAIHETGLLPSRQEAVPLKESAGRVLARAVIPYPPGIPLVCPGEIITEEDIRVIERFHDNGVSVIGLGQDGTVRVGV